MSKNIFLSNNSDLTTKNDIVFKTLFESAESESILKNFLESILSIQIQSLSLDLATELLPEFSDGKQMRVDVRTTLSDGTQVNIKMQTSSHGYSDERCLQHWSKLYSTNLKKKQLEIAKKMKAEGMASEIISKVTSLSVEEIQKL